MSANDGGYAFPLVDPVGTDNGFIRDHLQPGMSLRDYFAAKAMHAVLRGPDPTDTPASEFADLVARTAYHMADAMLRARAPKDQP